MNYSFAETWDVKTEAFYETLMEKSTFQSRVEMYGQNKVNDKLVGRTWKDVEFKLKDIKDIRVFLNIKFLYNIEPVSCIL